MTLADLASLSAHRKAAILMLRVGIQDAGPLLKSLRHEELILVVREFSNLGRVDPELADEVLKDFLETARHTTLPSGDEEVALEFLESTFGEHLAQEILGESRGSAPAPPPFHFIASMDAYTAVENLGGEHPQVVALVLSYLKPAQAAAIISALPSELAVEVGMRLGTMEKVSSDAITSVEEGLRHRFASVLENNFVDSIGGVDSLVGVIALSDKAVEDAIMQGLTQYDADLAAEVRAKLFVFDDLELLTDRQMQVLLRTVDSSDLPLALKGVNESIRDQFLNNLSSRARENLLDEIELLGSVRMSDVEAAQTTVLDVVRSLEESGDLVIDRGGGDFVS